MEQDKPRISLTPLKKFYAFLESDRRMAMLSIVTVLLCVAILDYVTGENYEFSIFCQLPC